MELKRSPLFYVGDKYKIIGEIKKYFPANINRFIEPFLGGGSVFLNINANEYVLNDIDKNIYTLHKFLEKQANRSDEFFKDAYKIIKRYKLSRSYFEDIVPGQLKKKWIKTYYARYNKSGYEKLRNHYNKNNKETLDLYILLVYGFNRMLRFNSDGNFNVPVGNVDFNMNVYNSLNNYFGLIKERNVKWYNLDYKKFLRSLRFRKNDFIYLDPPYLISNSEYNKLWNNDNEQELLNLLDELDKKKIKFALSNIVFHKGRENSILKKWMKKYNPYKINSNYISYHDNSIKKSREVLVTNYE